MPVFEFTEKHQLSRKEVKIRLTSIVDSLIEEFRGLISKPQINWEGYTGHFSYQLMGRKIKVIIEVREQNVISRIHYPVFLRPFKSIVIKATQKRAKALLSKDNTYHEGF